MAPLLSLSFPDALGHIFTASDTVRGHVGYRMEVDPKSGKAKFDTIHAKLRCVLVSTYHHETPAKAGSKPGEREEKHVDTRRETVQLYGEDLLLWSSSSFYPSPPGRQPMQPSTIRLPWSFVLPGPQMNLPGSFEGGMRNGKVLGNQVGRITYFVKITGNAPGMFNFNERQIAPFIYHPPSVVHPQHVPMPLFPRGSALPPFPPRAPTAQEGWGTLKAEKEYKETLLFGKKNRVVVRLTIPTLQAFPRSTPIPYHLSILILAHPSITSPSDVIVPPLSDLKLTLVRHISSRAHGATQAFKQVVGPAIDLRSEGRVWKVAPAMRDLGGGERRMCGEVVVVGEMMFGGETGPSFGGTGTRGLLTCDYSISLNLELKGPMNDLEVRNFFAPIICSNVNMGQQQYWHQQSQHHQQQQYKADVPAGYWDLTGDFGDDAK